LLSGAKHPRRSGPTSANISWSVDEPAVLDVVVLVGDVLEVDDKAKVEGRVADEVVDGGGEHGLLGL
jgi:hypothetical protein